MKEGISLLLFKAVFKNVFEYTKNIILLFFEIYFCYLNLMFCVFYVFQNKKQIKHVFRIFLFFRFIEEKTILKNSK